jgi:hypothetical protein
MSSQRFQVVTGPDREIEVSFSGEAYVKVMDRVNLSKYQVGDDHEFHGESGKVTNVKIKVPFLGRWFIIVDSGDGSEVSVAWRLLD